MAALCVLCVLFEFEFTVFEFTNSNAASIRRHIEVDEDESLPISRCFRGVHFDEAVAIKSLQHFNGASVHTPKNDHVNELRFSIVHCQHVTVYAVFIAFLNKNTPHVKVYAGSMCPFCSVLYYVNCKKAYYTFIINMHPLIAFCMCILCVYITTNE